MHMFWSFFLFFIGGRQRQQFACQAGRENFQFSRGNLWVKLKEKGMFIDFYSIRI